jgi:serine/threonine protein kinase
MSSKENGAASHEAAIGDIRKASIDDLLRTAEEIVQEKARDSQVLDTTAEARVRKLDLHSIKVGRVIGRGGFCIVREIEKIKSSEVSKSSRSISTSGTGQASMISMLTKRFRRRRGLGRENSKRSMESADLESLDIDTANLVTVENLDMLAGRKSRGKYVLKQVATDLRNDDKVNFLKGVVDLAMEAKFLASLDHPNIIRLTGECVDGPFQLGYFVVIEKLQETLTKRIKTWMDIDRQNQGITGVIPGSKRRMEEMERDRLIAAYDIARAGGYLHSKRIIFRDLVSHEELIFALILPLLFDASSSCLTRVIENII